MAPRSASSPDAAAHRPESAFRRVVPGSGGGARRLLRGS